MGKDKGRAFHLLNDIGHSESLARTGHAEQSLSPDPGIHTVDKLLYSFGLVAGGSIF